MKIINPKFHSNFPGGNELSTDIKLDQSCQWQHCDNNQVLIKARLRFYIIYGLCILSMLIIWLHWKCLYYLTIFGAVSISWCHLSSIGISIMKIAPSHDHLDGSVQDCGNSSALAMELLQSCTKPCIILICMIIGILIHGKTILILKGPLVALQLPWGMRMTMMNGGVILDICQFCPCVNKCE